MTRRQRIWQEVLALLLMIIVSFSLTPVSRNYDAMSYADFVGLMKDSDISSIKYCAEEKYAIIHQESVDKDFKISIVSLENFEKDVYEYSLTKSDFSYSNVAPIRQLGFFYRFIILLMVNISFKALYKSIIIKRSLKKMGVKNSKEINQEQYKELNRKFKFSFGGFTPRKVGGTDVKFTDVIGLEKQIDELQDIVRFLKNPEKYEEIGANLPRGVLIYGKPGVGKTYIARAIAGEAGVPFYETSASELQSKFLGESEENIRRIFDEAERNAPSILYIDEIDSIAVKRYSENSNRYAASILNQLLACMDGFTKDSKVIVIAATNHIDTLDDALLRSGRFDRKIFIHEPDKEARFKLIEYYSQDKVMADEVDVGRLVDVTAGLTGADIKTIINEAALLAVRKGKQCIDEDTIMEAYRTVMIGSENNYSMPSKENLMRTAIHEAGHAIVSNYFGQKVSEISIISRGTAAGYNLATPDEESEYNFDDLKHRIMNFLGGRAAEEHFYKDVSAGASDDLKKASTITKDMFLRFAMRDDKKISLVMTDDSRFNEMVAQDSYEAMNTFFERCYEETKEIIAKNEKKVKDLADALVSKETLSQEEIEAIIA